MKYFYVKDGEHSDYNNRIIAVDKHNFIVESRDIEDDIVHHPFNSKGEDLEFLDTVYEEDEDGDEREKEVEVCLTVIPVYKKHLKMFVFKKDCLIKGKYSYNTGYEIQIKPAYSTINFLSNLLSDEERDALIIYHKEKSNEWYKNITAE